MKTKFRVTVVRSKQHKNLMLRYIDPITRRQKHKSAGTTNARDADKARWEWEQKLNSAEPDYDSFTWQYFRERYESEVLTNAAPATDRKCQYIFKSIEQILSPVLLVDVDASRISLLQSKLGDGKLAQSTIKSYLSHLKAALNWAASIGLLAKVPKITMPKRAKGSKVMKGRPISGEEFDRLIDAVPKVVGAAAAPSWQHYLLGLWLSGLRLSESLQLTWDRDDKLRVDLQPGSHPVFLIPSELEKGNKDRMLPMAPEFAEYLAQTSADQRSGYVFNPMNRRTRGPRLGHVHVSKLIAEIGKAAGIKVNTDPSGKVKTASCHDLRRSFGLRWASRVMPQILMELMRHESIDTTMKYYVGRNAQKTASVLWEAHRAATGNFSGNFSTNGGKAVILETTEKQGV